VRFSNYSFGSVRVDGVTYDHDVIINGRRIRAAHQQRPWATAIGNGWHVRARKDGSAQSCSPPLVALA